MKKLVFLAALFLFGCASNDELHAVDLRVDAVQAINDQQSLDIANLKQDVQKQSDEFILFKNEINSKLDEVFAHSMKK